MVKGNLQVNAGNEGLLESLFSVSGEMDHKKINFQKIGICMIIYVIVFYFNDCILGIVKKCITICFRSDLSYNNFAVANSGALGCQQRSV